MKKLSILFLITVFFTIELLAAAGKLVAVNGEVFIFRTGTELKATIGMDLEEKDKIVTKANGSTQIIFEDKTTITIGKNSDFSIDEYINDDKVPSAKFSMGVGAFRAITGKIGKIAPNRFKIKTKTASIGIRGTQFIVNATPTTTIAACTQSTIIVTSIDTGVSVEVNQGQMTQVEQNKAPETPKPFTAESLKKLVNKIDDGGKKEEKNLKEEKESKKEEKKETKKDEKESKKEEKKAAKLEEKNKEEKQATKEEEKNKEEKQTSENKEEAKDNKNVTKEGESKDTTENKEQTTENDTTQEQTNTEETTENDTTQEQTNTQGTEEEQSGGQVLKQDEQQNNPIDNNSPQFEEDSTPIVNEPTIDEPTVDEPEPPIIIFDEPNSNNPPVSSISPSYSLYRNSTINVANEFISKIYDPDGDQLNIDITAKNGQIEGFEYIPNENLLPNDVDTITIVYSDGEFSFTQTIDIVIANNIPTVINLTKTIDAKEITIDGAKTYIISDYQNLVSNFEDADGDTLTIILDDIKNENTDKTIVIEGNNLVYSCISETCSDLKIVANDSFDKSIKSLSLTLNIPLGSIYEISTQVVSEPSNPSVDGDSIPTRSIPDGATQYSIVSSGDTTLDGLVTYGYWLDSTDNILGTYTSGTLTPETTMDTIIENAQQSIQNANIQNYYQGTYSGGVIGTVGSDIIQNGNVNLNIDFSQNSLDGSMSFDAGSNHWSANINNGIADSQGFESNDITKATDSTADITSGTLSGQYYGVNGPDAIGGSFSLDSSNAGTANGSFTGIKQ